MHLSNLIAPADGAAFTGEDKKILGLTADSRAVRDGFAFIAVPGTQMDGRTYIPDAVAKGATAIIAPQGTDGSSLPPNVTFVTVPDARIALSRMASRFYPRQPQTIAAVTGTSGKTSTVQFARELWELTGHSSASIGTLGVVAPGINRYGSLTTPDPVSLHKAIDEVAGLGCTHLAMEASSHGIELNRLDYVNLSVAAFTNLSRDHLDYHKTMDAYFEAKARLFTTLLPSSGTAVLNADIPEYETLRALSEARGIKIIGFGRAANELKLLSYAPLPHGQNVSFELLGKKHDIVLPIVGEFQVFNSLCALAIAIAGGADEGKAIDAMTRLSGVPGRLQRIGTTPSGGSVLVDYAHKPAALENVLGALHTHVAATAGAKLHVVFGCGGNRDKGKRPLMGEIAMRLADNVIVTDDNPRKEDAATIRAEVLAGCKGPASLREIGDRGEAIKVAIEGLGKGDVLVIAGKGHEEGQIVGDQVLPFNDAKVAQTVLDSLK